MDIKIKATKMELTPAIESAINEKLGGLEKYFDNIIGCEVEVGRTTNHHNKGDVYYAEINLEVPKKVIRAEAQTNDLYKALNEVKDKIKGEIMKYKEMFRPAIGLDWNEILWYYIGINNRPNCGF